MKKTLLSLIFLFAMSFIAHAQWTANGADIYTNNAGSVAIGATAPTAINASAALFPSITPRFSVSTGTGTGTYSDLVVFNHPGLNVDAVQRQIGLLLKLSYESTVVESDKMGGMILESSLGYGNYPSLSLVTANNRRLTVDYSGNIGIGIIAPQNKLDVNGTIHAKSVKIDLNGWGDYVFKKDYRLLPLTEVKAYIDKNQHLPEIPSEQEMIKKGLDVSDMNTLLMKKVEELTLYLIEKDEQDKKINKQLNILRTQVAQLKKLVKTKK